MGHSVSTHVILSSSTVVNHSSGKEYIEEEQLTKEVIKIAGRRDVIITNSDCKGNSKRAATLTIATILLCAGCSTSSHLPTTRTATLRSSRGSPSTSAFVPCHQITQSGSLAQRPEVEPVFSSSSLCSFQYRETHEGASSSSTPNSTMEYRGADFPRLGNTISPVMIKQLESRRSLTLLSSNSNSASGSDRIRTIHYNEALLDRIVSGRKSTSSKWRKRTRRAAASLGFSVKKYKEVNEGSSSLPLNISGGAVPLLPTGRYSSLPVPPLQLDASEDDTPPANKTRNPLFERFRKRKRRRQLNNEEYQKAKLEWASRYTSINTLRSTFGTNRNRVWGDFDPSTTRKLYNTLLPRALLGLYEMGLWSPTDLAPLAYEARVVAKKYARERCVVPGRVVAMLYDGFRSWKDWGTWSVEGLSWEQVWYKYEVQILDEMGDGVSEEEITAQICLRILEKSCITNERINRLLISNQEEVETEKRTQNGKNRKNADRYLEMIASKLEMDMQQLLEANEKEQSNFNATRMNTWIPLLT